MKFVSQDSRTRQYLKRWAGDSDLHIATYYFWNQGSDLQKSRVGLFQSLLYQILRTAPELITADWLERPHDEAWTMEELRTAFQKIAGSTKLDSRLCFFIDGLDEYEGAEEDVTDMLKVLAAFEHIKICASSRPNRHYEEFMKRRDRTFDIADFTQEDMARHARTILGDCEKFQLLAKTEPDCAKIITDISAWAQGVWLWVRLITSEIRKEANKGETVRTLRKIVNEFPSDLDKLFRRMIEKIQVRYREEMAQIFLIAIEELQPLPIYSFALLEQEQLFKQYAVRAKIQPFDEGKLREQYHDLNGRIQNRCGDLLVVDNLPHPVFLSNSVDFLHRTARDFLRDNFRKDLDSLVKDGFNPLISLCNICLALLKGADIKDFRKPASLKIIIGLTDELLYYAHELERRFGDSIVPHLLPILDELDKTNTAFTKRSGGNNHWTNARDPPPAQGLDSYAERGTCNFLGLAVQARLTGYVRAKLLANPRSLRKDGRPLLDYALRPLRITPLLCRTTQSETKRALTST